MALTAEVINRAKELYRELSAGEFAPLPPAEKRHVLLDVYDEITASLEMLPENIQALYHEILPKHITKLRQGNDMYTDYIREKLVDMLTVVSESEPAPDVAPPPPPPSQGGNRPGFSEPRPRMPRPPPSIPPVPQPPAKGGRTSKIGKRFDKCVKSVRRTVKPRRNSTKESAAIAICTTTILHPQKRTIKRYRKGRLVTQRRKAF